MSFYNNKDASLPTGLYTILYPRTGEGEGSQDTLNLVYHSSEMCMFWGGSSPTKIYIGTHYWPFIDIQRKHTTWWVLIMSIDNVAPWKKFNNIPKFPYPEN